MYDDAFDTAVQSTLIDFCVDDVGVALTPVGVESVTVAFDTLTAVLELLLWPSPSWPKSPRPQHLIVLSMSTAHVCRYPAEICETAVTPETAVGTNRSAESPRPS